MPKAFSVASWNVEHFKGAQSRVERVVAYLTDLDPDVLAKGWIDEPTLAKKRLWSERYSDHNLLYFEVEPAV